MYKINKYSAVLPQFGVWSAGFTEEEIEKIVFLEKILKFEKGIVGDNNPDVNIKARNSKVSFLGIDQNTEWIWQRLAGIVPKANYDLFMKDIEAIQSLQYTIYSSKDKQFYDWHVDRFSHYLDFQRKISVVIMLSDPDEYEGGELEIITAGNPTKSEMLKPAKGDVVLFSSEMPHKVHPVTKGIRKSLVSWVIGKSES